jgi:thioredoxin-related protein
MKILNKFDDYMINFIKNELKQDNYRLEQSRDWFKKHLNFVLNIQSFDENELKSAKTRTNLIRKNVSQSNKTIWHEYCVIATSSIFYYTK